MTKNARRKLNLLNSIKMFIGAMSVATYFMEHEKIAFWMLVIGAMLDSVISYYTRDLEITKD